MTNIQGVAISGPYHRDGFNLSAVLRLLRERGDPQAKHTCGDYETVARCTSATWDRDSKIIVDALNVHHETGHGPRQLAEQNAALLAALESLIPKKVAINNPNVPDSTVVPVDITVGKLRTALAAMDKSKRAPQ